MIPAITEIEALHKKYSRNEKTFELIFTHCKIVAEIALWCADQISEPVDRQVLETAALLHDIGSHAFLDEEGMMYTIDTYVLHAVLGAKLLQDESVDRRIVDAVETHPLMGWTKEDVQSLGLKIPAKDYMPRTTEAEILCYADDFHSKRPIFITHDTYVEYLEDKLPQQVPRFKKAVEKYGVPDIEALAKKYGHPVK